MTNIGKVPKNIVFEAMRGTETNVMGAKNFHVSIGEN